MRAILVLYLLEEYFNNDFTTALSKFAFFSLLVGLTAPLGGLLGDFVLKNKLALIVGGGLQVIGILLFIGIDQVGIYLPFIIIAIGTGLYRTNFLAMFGKLYLDKPRTIEAGFTFHALAVNLGAFVGILLIGLIADKWSYEIGFVIAGFFMVLATVTAIFFKQSERVEQTINDSNVPLNDALVDDQLVKPKELKPRSLGSKSMLLVVAVLGTVFFWGMSEIYYSIHNVYEELNGIRQISGGAMLNQNLQLLTFLIVGAATAIAWTFIYFNKFIKLAIGIFCLGLSFLLLVILPMDQGIFTVWAISFAILIGLAEIHIAPVLYSTIVQNVEARYLAIAMSFGILAMNLSGVFFSWITSEIDYYIWEYPSQVAVFVAILIIIISIPILVLGIIKSKRLRLISLWSCRVFAFSAISTYHTEAPLFLRSKLRF